MTSDFSSVPILDYSLVGDPVRKPDFIVQLRHALINVGFLYLSNPPVSEQDVDTLVAYIPQLFALPQATKDSIRMANSEHFLGYSKLGSELTKNKMDHREQFDFGTPHNCMWKPGEPDYYRLWGESQVNTLIYHRIPLKRSQWLDEDVLPGFRACLLRYIAQVRDLGYGFSKLIAEALGLPSDGLDHFYDSDDRMQHRVKVGKAYAKAFLRQIYHFATFL
jgi:isopenicillin N synthase-like dioxygenase